MTQTTGLARNIEIVDRWRQLAERRLAFLDELYASGRWRLYHTEQAFVDNIRDAKRAVEAWKLLATPGNAPAEAADHAIATDPVVADPTTPAAFVPQTVSSASLLPPATLTLG